MALRLRITSEHQELVGDDANREFAEIGGSIGRSLRNDWILPDPDRYISGRHAMIDYRGGMYYLADLSTNGVYINDDTEAVGRGNPRRLFDGDRLRMGDFEISVSIDDDQSLDLPDENPSTLVKEHVDQQVPEVSLETSDQMLDEEEITGGDAFKSALFDTSLNSAASDKATSDTTTPDMAKSDTAMSDTTASDMRTPDTTTPDTTASDTTTPDRTMTERSINTPQSKARARSNTPARSKVIKTQQTGGKTPLKTPVRVETSSNDLFDVFLDGIGLDRSELHPSVDPAEVMKNAGQVMRELVSGMARLLVSRANLKTAFALDQTTILPRHNNPLKLSQNPADSIKQLLVGRAGEYLGPRDAVREVCRDLLFHQDAFLDAMSAAFGGFADRFDPEELTASFESESESKSMLGFKNKPKYWELYCEYYPTMTARGPGRFPTAFAKDFIKAYERQIADFIRLNPQEPDRLKPAVAQAQKADDIDLKATVSDQRSNVFDPGPTMGRAAR